MSVVEMKKLADAIRAEVAKAVVGQDKAVDLLLTALFTGGHILLEGPPGTAKTLLAQSFAAGGSTTSIGSMPSSVRAALRRPIANC